MGAVEAVAVTPSCHTCNRGLSLSPEKVYVYSTMRPITQTAPKPATP